MHKRLIPLALAYADGGDPIEGRTRLQKMVFIVQQELADDGVLREEQQYEFFPYDYGPFSKELADAIDDMIDKDLLDEEDVVYDDDGNIKYLYELKGSGRELVEQELDRDDLENFVETIRRVKRRYNDELSLPEVIDEVYSEYPEYAEESVYWGRI